MGNLKSRDVELFNQKPLSAVLTFSLHFFNIQLNYISKFVPAHRIACFDRNTFEKLS